METKLDILRRYFGYTSFRRGQEEIVNALLISLMKDQVESLTQAGVHAAYLNSSLTPAQYSRALHNLSEGLYKLVYVAPERLSTENFRTAVELSLIHI